MKMDGILYPVQRTYMFFNQDERKLLELVQLKDFSSEMNVRKLMHDDNSTKIISNAALVIILLYILNMILWCNVSQVFRPVLTYYTGYNLGYIEYQVISIFCFIFVTDNLVSGSMLNYIKNYIMQFIFIFGLFLYFK